MSSPCRQGVVKPTVKVFAPLAIPLAAVAGLPLQEDGADRPSARLLCPFEAVDTTLSFMFLRTLFPFLKLGLLGRLL
jgi:hypothetical protein